MPEFLLLFLIFVFALSLIFTVIGIFSFYGKDVDIDSQYYDHNGDHIYYDRSLIEKKLFRKRFPNINNLRSFRRLLKE